MTKKILSLLTVLLMAAAWSTASAENYGLTVAGVPVTSDNAADIKVSGMSSGSISYDAQFHRLTLNGVTLRPSTVFVSSADYDAPLKIQVVGDNKIDMSAAGDNVLFDLHTSTTFEQGGSLTSSGGSNDGILTENSIYIEGPSLNVKYFLSRGGLHEVSVSSTASTVTARDNITGFYRLLLRNGFSFTTPNVRYDGNKRCVVDMSGNEMKGVTIGKVDTKGLLVSGFAVSSANSADIKVAGMTRGKISFDSSTNTLTLDNIYVESPEILVKSSDFSDKLLTIKLVGDNVVKLPNGSLVFLLGTNTIITGTGSLTSSGGNDGIRAETGKKYATLTIEGGCQLDVMYIDGNEYNTLIVSDANTKIHTRENLWKFTTVTLNDGLWYSSPNGVRYQGVIENHSDGTFSMVDGVGEYTKPARDITIEKMDYYGIKVLDALVCKSNCSDIKSEYIKGGKISYDPTTSTITMDNVTVSGAKNTVIWGEDFKDDMLTVRLIGDNQIGYMSGGASVISSESNLHVTGTGSLTSSGGGNDGISVTNGKSLTIDGGCQINVRDLFGNPRGTLTIAGAKTKITTLTTIERFASITLQDGLDFSAPNGAHYGTVSDIRKVVDADGKEAGNITIERFVRHGLTVAGVPVTSLNADNITAPGITAGKVSYNEEARTLTLENARIVYNQGAAISTEGYTGNGLLINLVGDNQIETGQESNASLDLFHNVNIAGTGSLTTSSKYTIPGWIHGTDRVLIHNNKLLQILGGCTVSVARIVGGQLAVGGKTTKLIARQNVEDMTAVTLLDGLRFYDNSGTYDELKFDASWHCVSGSKGSGQYVDGFTATASANVTPEPTDYGLTVAGVKVTSANAASITGPGISGRVSFDPKRRALLLTDATISYSGPEAIADKGDLTIVAEGNNTISGATWSVLCESSALYIFGSGTLTCDAINIYNGGSMTVTANCQLNVKNYVVASETATASAYIQVVDDGSTLTVGKTIRGFSYAFYPTVSPTGYTYDSERKVFTDANGNEATKGLTLGGQSGLDDYSLSVADVQVGSDNAANISGQGIRGLVRFDVATNTLTLSNANINYASGAIRYSGNRQLNIQVAGFNNTVGITRDAIVMENGASLNIIGNSQLTVEGIRMEGGGQLFIGGGCRVITHQNVIQATDAKSLCTISDAATTVTTHGLMGFGNLKLDGVVFNSPAGATYSTTQHDVVEASGKVATGTISIGAPTVESYGLKVGYVLVTEANCKAVTGSAISGSVSYAPAAKTLTLNGATISGGIQNLGVDELKIRLQGTNTLRGESGLFVTRYTELTGGGTLNIDVQVAPDSIFMLQTPGIYVVGDNNTAISLGGGATVYVKSNSRGMAAANHVEGLVFDGTATLTVEPGPDYGKLNGSDYAAVSGFGKYTLGGSKVTTPGNGSFSTSLGGVTTDGKTLYTGRVVFSPRGVEPDPVEEPVVGYGLTVGGIAVTSKNASNLTGGNITGHATYYPADNRLYLSGTIGGETPISIGSSFSGTEITFEGSAQLNATGANSLYIAKPELSVTINSGSTLQGNKALWTNAQTLTIGDGASVHFSRLTAQGTTRLVVGGSEARVYMDGDNAQPTLSGFTTVSLPDGLAFARPAGSSYSAAAKRLNDDAGSAVTGQARIAPPQPQPDQRTYFGLTVAGVEVTSENKTAITGSGISGEVSYDNFTQTLTLNNATVDGPIVKASKGYSYKLAVKLWGTNRVQSIETHLPTYIEGTGMLKATGGIEAAEGVELSLSANVEAGYVKGLSGKETLRVSQPLTVDGAVSGFASLTTDGLSFVSPQGGSYNATRKTVVDKSGADATSGVSIGVVTTVPEPTVPQELVWYDVDVCGENFSNANLKGLKSDKVTGLVTYEPSTRTLTLNNATLRNFYGIYVTSDLGGPLTIELVGTNRIITDGIDAALTSYQPVTIKGSGTLTTDGDLKLWGLGQNSIKGCTINAVRIWGESSTAAQTLTIDNANVTLAGTIENMNKLELKDAIIMTPQDGKWTYATGLIIVPASQTKEITLKAADVEYTFAEFRNNVTSSDLIDMAFTSSGEEPLLGEPQVECDIPYDSPVGTYPIRISRGTVRNLKVKYVDGTLTIKKSPLSIVANSYTMEQGGHVLANTFDWQQDFHGITAGDDLYEKLGQVKISSNVYRTSAPGTYPVSISGPAESTNYLLNYAPGTVTVVEASPITLTATSFIRTYGDANPGLTFTTEGAPLLDDGEPDLWTDADVWSPAGKYEIRIEKGSVRNYNDHYVNGTLTIEKAPLTVTARDYTIMQGEQLPAEWELDYDGWKLQEREGILDERPAVSCAATKDSPAGQYALVVTGGRSDRYNLIRMNGTLTIIPSTGIVDLQATGTASSQGVWTMDGRKVRNDASSLDGLPKGVYIVNGRKVVVKK